MIIGGGAVGCALAYTLSQYDVLIALLERNPDVCMETSGKNSAVIHAGFNNSPGSLMARLCVQGNKEFEEYCKILNVPYKKTGKMVVALNDDDLPLLDEILEQGNKNGCVGLRKLYKAEMNTIEPNVCGIAAMYSENTAVIDPFLYTIHLAEAAIQNGVEFFMNSEVTAINCKNDKYEVYTNTAVYSTAIVINSAGLYSDIIASMIGDTQYKIYPSRGEYLLLDKQSSELVSMPVYPVPRKGVGGLGVHLTTTIDGNMLIGPSAEYVDSPETYATTQQMLEQLYSEAKQLLPQIDRSMIIGQYTGIRPKIIQKGSDNFGDFIIKESENNPDFINLIGIESPGLTASLPLAKCVAEMLNAKHSFSRNTNYKAEYKGSPIFRDLTVEQQNALIKDNPEYGEIVCRCENITRAEVLNALNNPLGSKSVVSVKNRTRATMGRCNGGYCLTRIVDSITKQGVAPEDITYRHIGDKPFVGCVK